MTTGKIIALTRWTFVGKVISLLLNMLSRLVITFLPRSISIFLFHGCSHHLQWFCSCCFHYFPIYLPCSDGTRWDGWMASLTRWTWVSVNSRSWWWTGRPGVLQFMWSQRVGHDWATDLIWSDLMGPDATILVFWMLNFKPTFSFFSFSVLGHCFQTLEEKTCIQLRLGNTRLNTWWVSFQ